MKNKPERHKESNTFRTRKYVDILNDIDVKVFRRVAHKNELPDENARESNFYLSLMKWNLDNLTEGFASFKRELPEVQTLELVLLHEQKIVTLLKDYLKKKDISFVEPILDLTLSLAKDLSVDFYKHFINKYDYEKIVSSDEESSPSLFKLIIDLLTIPDIQIVECTFKTLAYLFKSLWVVLISNIKEAIYSLLPLFSSKNKYFNEFAAETFSFVARKVKDVKGFLFHIFNALEINPSSTKGYGKLLFQVIAGTTGRFHSNAENFLDHYIDALNADNERGQLVYNVIEQVFICITESIDASNSDVLWKILSKNMDKYSTEDTPANQKIIIKILKLTCLLVNFKNGVMLRDLINNNSKADNLKLKITNILSTFEDNNDVLTGAIDLAVLMLLASNIELTQQTSSDLVSKLLMIQDKNVSYYAIEKLINHSSFETLILPRTLIRIQRQMEDFDDNELRLFAKIVTSRSPHCLKGSSLNTWRKIKINLPKRILTCLKDKLINWQDGNNISESSLKIIIILPHLMANENIIETLKNVTKSIYEKLNNQDCCTLTSAEIENNCYGFLLAIESLIHILDAKNFHEFIRDLNLLDFFKKHLNVPFILDSMDLILTYMSNSKIKSEYINIQTFEVINEFLEIKLTSPYRKVRLTVCHIYSLFSTLDDLFADNNDDNNNVLKRLFIAENIDVLVQTYRERLIHIQALAFETKLIKNFNPKYLSIPLRFLLGNFYVNFSLLWNPVSKIVSSYADENFDQFWTIFLEELKKEVDSNHLTIDTISDGFFSSFNCDVLTDFVEKLTITDKPDHQNYKVLLWTSMHEFSEYAEMKNRDVTPIFIDYVEDNFLKSNIENAKSCSLIRKEKFNETIDEDDDDDDDDDDVDDDKEEEEEENKEKITKKNKTRKFVKSSKLKLLLAQLQVLSKIKNPRSLYREQEINKIYLELLISKSGDLQKAALDCLVTYKYTWLLPYKNNLYGLIDEKNLRNELTRFQVTNEENSLGTILPNDREYLMPIVMRIIYAKMISRGTGRSASGFGGPERRKALLRFLMGCKEEEMMLFINMAFKIFETYGISLSSNEEIPDLNKLTIELMANIDLNNVIPPRRLTSAVNLLSIIIKEFGAKMSNYLLPKLLAILISIMSQIKIILDKSDIILPGYIKIIKELKNNCINIIAKFFKQFNNYNWSNSELDALFNVGVFPYIEKLPNDGIYSPTSLLKLLSQWAHNARFFCLLVKHEDNNTDKYPLKYIIELLMKKKIININNNKITRPINSQVINEILKMIGEMLKQQDYGVIADNEMEVDDIPEIIPLNPNNILSNSHDKIPSVDLNYGTKILLPHIPDILKFMEEKFERTKNGINTIESFILERISEIPLDPEVSNNLVALLLPTIIKRASRGESEEIIDQSLTTILHLIKDVKEPQIHIRAILPLLSIITSSVARKTLFKLLSSIAEKIPESSLLSRDIFQQNVNILTELNAYDKRWVEQADIEKRLSAFEMINKIINSDNEKQLALLTLEFGVSIIHSCFYFLKNEKDQALLDRSEDCLKKIGPLFGHLYKDNKIDRSYLMNQTILVLIKNNITSKGKDNESLRFGSLTLLRSMSIECPDIHPVFRDLNLLTDKVDNEVDFFENIKHLQFHRISRALDKFSLIAKTKMTKPNTKTIVEFIYPIASYYLCNPSFESKNSIIDSSINAVGACCRLLSWNRYLIILEHHLNKLKSSNEFQRQLTRIVITILDAFHYDLSKLDTVDDNICKYVPEFKKKSKIKIDDIADDDDGDVDVDDEDKNINEDEKLHKDLEKISDAEEEIINDDNKIINNDLVLSNSIAKQLISDIKNKLLPQLHNVILSRTDHEKSHKVNRRSTGSDKEEQELMRVPISLAMVKLLQKLPGNILDNKNYNHLPRIFMKLCTFLKSRLESVRRETRKILEQIMLSLGPDYLHHLLGVMNSILTKGFEVHVLAYTMHAVLTCLKDKYKENHINDNLISILDVCKVDIFGITGEEKDVIGVVKRTSEAKTTKSYDIYNILGQYISASCLIDLIKPLVVKLNTSRSSKIINKVNECLRHALLGLADNTFIQTDQMLQFLNGIMSESIPNLFESKKINNDSKHDKLKKIEKPDSRLIQPAPKNRMGAKLMSGTSSNTNDHIIQEFSLKLFHILLKRDKIKTIKFKPYLEPFVEILVNFLKSKHTKISSLSLQCLSWILKFDLHKLTKHIKDIVGEIFDILDKYGTGGKGEILELTMAAFKTMAVIVRDVKYFNLSGDQIEKLLLSAKTDLDNEERQVIAFNLIRSMLNRKIIITKLFKTVMYKISELSITSQSENIRLQSRVAYYTYLNNYQHNAKKFEIFIVFYLQQLGYDTIDGRKSALTMIQSIVSGFTTEKLNDIIIGLIFVKVGARLVDDDEPSLREMSADIIAALLSKIDDKNKDLLFEMVLAWFSDKNELRNCILAAQLCGIFVVIEGDKFEKRYNKCLPVILQQFYNNDDDGPGKLVRAKPVKKKLEIQHTEDIDRLKDHHIIHMLILTCKISMKEECTKFLTDEKWNSYVKLLAEVIGDELLRHQHNTVRYYAVQQMRYILSSLDIENISNIINNKDNTNADDDDDDDGEFKWDVYKNPLKVFKKLTLDLIDQIHPDMIIQETADEVIKCVFIISKIIKSTSWSSAEETNKIENNGLSLFWILKRLRKAANFEVTQNSKSIVVRKALFSWIKSIVINIPLDPYLRPILFPIMSPLVREIDTTDEKNAPLRQEAKVIAEKIKSRMEVRQRNENTNGNIEDNNNDGDYARLLHKVQQKIMVKRGQRSIAKKQQYVTDPEIAAKRKIARQAKKKESKKRKKTEMYGKSPRSKKRRMED
ncbi:small subunit processome component 20 homolog [Aphidius gifuensis]|uniref:small subunit processome component 20 homolog n=1 Tax=Aphidius gifuensis TaxID=684658 RepID=UPI001CDCB51A|nr:small subunit processome component 20 homolog [Aphidius gifuensis]